MDNKLQTRLLPRYLFLAEMNPGTNDTNAFDLTYDDHLAQLTSVPGVAAAARAWTHPAQVVIDGEVHSLPTRAGPSHAALYAIDSPSVLLSDEWRRAVDAGSWASSTRAQTSDREHRILRVASWWAEGRRVDEGQP